jgi:hypothetical protein
LGAITRKGKRQPGRGWTRWRLPSFNSVFFLFTCYSLSAAISAAGEGQRMCTHLALNMAHWLADAYKKILPLPLTSRSASRCLLGFCKKRIQSGFADLRKSARIIVNLFACSLVAILNHHGLSRFRAGSRLGERFGAFRPARSVSLNEPDFFARGRVRARDNELGS